MISRREKVIWHGAWMCAVLMKYPLSHRHLICLPIKFHPCCSLYATAVLLWPGIPLIWRIIITSYPHGLRSRPLHWSKVLPPWKNWMRRSVRTVRIPIRLMNWQKLRHKPRAAAEIWCEMWFRQWIVSAHHPDGWLKSCRWLTVLHSRPIFWHWMRL